METTNTTRTEIRIQAMGMVPAVCASDLRVGDVTIWNFGYTARVLSVVPASAKFVAVTMVSLDPMTDQPAAETHVRRMKTDRLVAYSMRARRALEVA